MPVPSRPLPSTGTDVVDLFSSSQLTTLLPLPTFTVAGMTLLRRLTMVVREGRIEHVLYPVFPPDQAATDVLAVLTH